MPAEDLVSAGELDRWVAIESPPAEPGSDDHAEPADRWRVICETWAAVKPLSSREQLLARQVVSSATHKVRIRWRPGITATMRIAYRGRTLYLEGPPQEIGRQQGLEMLCVEEER